MRRNRLHSTDNFERVLRESRIVQRAAPLGRTSVTNGRTEFNGNESLIVNGSQKVSGWLIVTGTLKGVGTLLWEGAMQLVGPVLVTGAARFLNTMSIEGVTTLLNNLVVKAAGKIIIEGSTSMVIGNDGDEAAVTFSTGGQLAGRPLGVVLRNTGETASVGATNSAYLLSGSKAVIVTSTGIKAQGLASPPAGTSVYHVVADSSGNLYRGAAA